MTTSNCIYPMEDLINLKTARRECIAMVNGGMTLQDIRNHHYTKDDLECVRDIYKSHGLDFDDYDCQHLLCPFRDDDRIDYLQVRRFINDICALIEHKYKMLYVAFV